MCYNCIRDNLLRILAACMFYLLSCSSGLSFKNYDEAFESSFDSVMNITVRGQPVRLDAPFVSTPQVAVERMVELADIKPGEVVYDLGCGDGRFLVEAAKRHGVRAIGVDIDPERVEEALENARAAGVEHLVTVTEGDIFDVDLKDADVVFLYLFSSLTTRLIPQLEQMKPGSRVLAFEFPIRGVKPSLLDRSLDKYGDGSASIFKWVLPFQPSASIDWDVEHINTKLDTYQTSLPIKYTGKNNSDEEIQIVDAIPDCLSCLNLSVSRDVIKPGESVEVSGDIALKARKGFQTGKITIVYELTADELSYNILFPLPYKFSQDILTWHQDRKPKVVTLQLDENFGYKYSNYRIEGGDFDVRVLNSDSKFVSFEVTPPSKGRIRSSLYIKLEPVEGKIPPNVRGDNTQELFVVLAVEDNGQ